MEIEKVLNIGKIYGFKLIISLSTKVQMVSTGQRIELKAEQVSM